MISFHRIMEQKITKQHLDKVYSKNFNKENFLSVDPCGIVYELKEHTAEQADIEIGALLVAMITWGNRKAIRTAARHMLEAEMEWQPARFIREGIYKDSYKNAKNNCVYRTLNATAFKQVCSNLQEILLKHNTLEDALEGLSVEQSIERIAEWLAPAKLGTAGKSACKRICMFLRWMVRDEAPDLGLWHSKDKSNLYAIMDVHVCQLTASILTRKQADWKSCSELTSIFRKWHKSDPLRYDIALMTLADMK